jgi:class 3 adenylate cyclase
MFCDLVGSTALSARLDPEDMREIISAYHRCCAEQITKAGGFVAKYMGDGCLRTSATHRRMRTMPSERYALRWL